MVKLIIDSREIEVPAGTKVIEAAARLGIVIPRFCYHPALGAVGACRVCAVKFEEGPVKGIQMSCMVDAAEGMRVSTRDAEAVDFRRHVIEWLMLNHPHDCPVCDEGGHCLLQDMTVAGGHGLRRFRGKKRTYPDQDLGPLIQHEMNRCIHCYRCERFYQDFCGYRDLGVLGIGNRTYFGRLESGTLQSPFAGNLADICPTGVFTDKPSRYFGRRWDYQRASTVCLHCSLGCSTTTSARYRQVVRQEARFHPAVNGYFICDRGRHGFHYANSPERPRTPRVNGRPADMGEAVGYARQRLADLHAASARGAVAVLGSTRSSLETLAAVTTACEAAGWRGPALFSDAAAARKAAAAADALDPDLAVSLSDIEAADAVVVVGCDPLNEAPMLALALRQCARKGGRLVVLDPRPVALPAAARHLPVAPRAMGAVFESLLRQWTEPASEGPATDPERAGQTATGVAAADLAAAASALKDSRRPVIVCGSDIPSLEIVQLSADGARRLAAAGKQAGLFYLAAGANAFAAGMFAGAEAGAAEILAAACEGQVRALVLVECDPFHTVPDWGLVERALSGLDLLVVLDAIDSPALKSAHVVLPTRTLFETGGLLINPEGRLQVSSPVLDCGLPIAQAGGGGHPPRVYGQGIPGDAPRPAWELVAQLAGREPASSPAAARREALARLARRCPAQEVTLITAEELPAEGLRLTAARAVEGENAPATPKPAPEIPDALEVILTERVFGTEELSAQAPCLRALAAEPEIALQRHDAARIGVGDGEVIAIGSGSTRVTATARVFDAMAAGVIVVPRHRRLAWQMLSRQVRLEDIRIL
jgi:NADH-quinone oxidoreductase subunit G